MIAADHIAIALEKQGVTHVYELVGGMITFMLDALHRRGQIEVVSMHHEQGAGFAAEGHARMHGLPAVAFATSGPGATNLLTAIGSCHFDSVPVVFITGQVNRHEQRGARAIRQLGFQETDIVAMAQPITKAAWLVNDPADLPKMIERAFELAQAGRPGPVLIDIPMDVQRAEVPEAAAPNPPAQATLPAEAQAFLGRMNEALVNSARPLIIAGGGCAPPNMRTLFRHFADCAGIPVVHSLMGVDLLPAAHPLRIGLLGSYGNRWANMAVAQADLLIVLGSRLDVRQTGADTAGFVAGKKVFHVDVEAGEINNRVSGCDALVAELGAFLPAAAERIRAPRAGVAQWLTEIAANRAKWPDTAELAGIQGINPNRFIQALSACPQDPAAFVADVGQHQMWAAQSLRLGENQRFLTSGGMGAMGFALPAAIGACFGAGRRPVVVVAGDGGFQLNIQELQTIVRNRLPLKMVVLNNGCHGMVRQFQESYFKSRFQSTVWGYSAPDFSKVAAAYGISSMRIALESEIESGLQALWACPSEPHLLEVMIAPDTNVYPKMAFGKPISEMEPFAKPTEMEGT